MWFVIRPMQRWIASVTATAAELNLLDGAAAGVVTALKCAVYDAAGKLFSSSATEVAAGTTVADAKALTAQNNVITGADGTKGVLLPIAAADEVVEIINTNITSVLKVYAITGSQINALGSTVAFSLGAGQKATFVGRSAILWHTATAADTIGGLTASAAELNLNDTAVAGQATPSKTAVYDAAGKLYESTATPAAAGTVVGDATALTERYNVVTGADGTVGVVLPIAAEDEIVTIINDNATNLLNVYAITLSQINALGSTVAYELAPGQAADFVGRSATLWNTAAAFSGLTSTVAELNILDGVTATAAELNLNDGLTATAVEVNEACDLTAQGLLVKTAKFAITVAPDGTEQDTTIVLPLRGKVLDVFLDSTTQEATGATKTIDIGLKSGEAGGDADGFMEAIDVSTAGFKKATLASGAQDLGALLYVDEDGAGALVPEAHLLNGTAITVTYTAGSVGDWVEFRGAIYVTYVEVG